MPTHSTAPSASMAASSRGHQRLRGAAPALPHPALVALAVPTTFGANITDVWYCVMTKLAPTAPIPRRHSKKLRISARERRAEHGKRAEDKQRRIDLARAVAVAHRADDEPYEDGRGDGGDVDIRDLIDGESELALDQRHQRRACEPREEADEERHPREVKSAHRHGAKAEEIDPGCFICHCLSTKQKGVP